MDVSEAPWDNEVTVAVDNVHMHYHVVSMDKKTRRNEPLPSRALRAVVGRQQKVVVRALAGISLVARRGESIGVIGTNGSGKSTLMRAIAGLETVTRGEVLASSTPVLLGVSAALLPELSGEQNVRLGCLAMGMSPRETEDLIPDIVELSGIDEAIHLPMKTYSSGMGARLRFAIAAAAQPQILLLDEALATGDAAFKERSEERMRVVREQAGTVFIVNHSAQVIEETCTRALWLHRGRVVLDGPARETARRYRQWAWSLAQGEVDKATALLKDAIADGATVPPPMVARTPRATGVPRHARRR